MVVLVDDGDHHADAGRGEVDQPAARQVLQGLLQGRAHLGALPAPPERALVPGVGRGGVVDQGHVGALLVEGAGVSPLLQDAFLCLH